jgi:adenylate cyclase
MRWQRFHPLRERAPRMRRGLLIIVGVAVAVATAVVALADPLRQLELDTVDARFAIRGTQPPPADVIAVVIDDVTFDELGVQWPFPRRMHGRVIDELRRSGAKVIAYDIQFTEPTTIPQDNALLASVRRARGQVVLATTEVNEFGESAVFGSEEDVRAAGARVGNALLPADSDGVNRRVSHTIDGMTGFAVATAETAQGRRTHPADFGDRGAWIDFHGPPGAIPSLSFSRVLRGRYEPAQFRDRIVVVGMSAPSQQDVHPTSASGERYMSGVEIHANAISTIRRGLPLSEVPRWLGVVVAVMLALVAPLAGLRMRPWRSLLIGLGAGAVYLAGAQLAFEAGLILPVVYPLGAVVASLFGVLAVEYSSVEYAREYTRELFCRFVPEAVVDQVLKTAEHDVRLIGQDVASTVVFCDLRGFTTFAEHRPARKVMDALNHYLEEMSEAIRLRGGTLLGYSGDGILAVFGAPLEQFDHADRALEAVRDMAGPRLRTFNDWLRSEKLGEGFRIGIGVNSGRITAGNVGSTWRVEYTAIGDAVNTASRLEALTKETPYQVLISDTTRSLLRRQPADLHYVDATAVPGKQVKVNLWTLDPGPDAADDRYSPAMAADAQPVSPGAGPPTPGS